MTSPATIDLFPLFVFLSFTTLFPLMLSFLTYNLLPYVFEPDGRCLFPLFLKASFFQLRISCLLSPPFNKFLFLKYSSRKANLQRFNLLGVRTLPLFLSVVRIFRFLGIGCGFTLPHFPEDSCRHTPEPSIPTFFLFLGRLTLTTVPQIQYSFDLLGANFSFFPFSIFLTVRS